jgi:hypothetical protein
LGSHRDVQDPILDALLGPGSQVVDVVGPTLRSVADDAQWAKLFI